MGRTRKKNRISSKIDELPSEIKGQVDVMLSDTCLLYTSPSPQLPGRQRLAEGKGL